MRTAKEVYAALWRIALPAAGLAAAVLVLAGSLGDWAADPGRWQRQSGDFYAEQGRALIHGYAEPTVSAAAPGEAVAAALFCQPASQAVQVAARGACLLLCVLLAFALGRLLHSAPAGALAALGAALVLPPSLYSNRWYYDLQVLAVGCALVWRARAPSPWRSVVLGLALGASLTVQSALLFFPPLLVLCELAGRKDRDDPSWRLQALLLCAVPLLFVIPWAAANWQLHRRFIPFDDGRARPLVVAGALGYASFAQGRWEAALSSAPPDRSLLAWALQQVWEPPLRYLASCWQRLEFAFRLQPVLCAAGPAAAWLLRRDRAHGQLALLAAYLLGVHCLLTVDPRYFEPAWPLLAVMGACALLSWREPEAAEDRLRLGSGILYAALAPVLALAFYSAGLAAAYPARADALSLDRRLAGRPGDSWLWSARGRRSLERGSPAEAAADFGKALARDPRRAELVGRCA
ncbi:MAG: hypothetical protein PHU21_11700, partial [Elusimicrobia bacterium]|nr:hypothetical protein [Elusimicrobiota bacterium]